MKPSPSIDRLSDSLDFLADTLKLTADQAGFERLNALAATGKAEEAEERASAAESVVEEIVAGKTAAQEEATEQIRYRMLSLARSLAVRSLNQTSDKDLQLLLAWQAFLFNNRNGGFAEDADVFSALYDVSKRYGNRFYARFSPDGADVTAMSRRVRGTIFLYS